ncbi:hypothetical protein [Thiomicrorhabdus sp.]|uniref:hypothetical protein n=1 Tax=Thiomicrorhabdus sp. TaxID=2039724 RepID=UPI0029C94D1E|nr:hypothetical protein [Thiomicrorhabdus sp.]
MKPITKKNLAAGLIGPLGLYPAFFVAWVVLALLDTYEGRASLESASDGLLLFLGMATVGLIYAYPLTIMFGLPSAAFLRKLNLFKLPIVLLISLIPVSILFGIFVPTFYGWLIYGYASLSVAFLCWLTFKWV